MKSATDCRIAAESASVDFDWARAGEMPTETKTREIIAKAAFTGMWFIISPLGRRQTIPIPSAESYNKEAFLWESGEFVSCKRSGGTLLAECNTGFPHGARGC